MNLSTKIKFKKKKSIQYFKKNKWKCFKGVSGYNKIPIGYIEKISVN